MKDKILCGVDIGGTKCSIALVREDGNIIDLFNTCGHTDCNESNMVGFISDEVIKLIKKNGLQESDIEGVGIGCAGHIRFRDGVIITTSNMKGFKNFPLRDEFRKNFSIPVVVDNDANAQAYGEYRFGAGKGCDDLVFMTISTGIGAGIIINGNIYHGYTGTAGEFGHTIVDPDSDLVCTCGNKGCLMGVASGLALPHLFMKKLAEGKKSTLDLPSNFRMDRMSGQVIKKGLETGDPVSTEIVLECAHFAGIGIYNIFQALNPQMIVLGGGLMNWGDIYFNRIKSTFYDLARDMIFDPVAIVISKIGSQAGVIGAASLTLLK